TGNEVDGRLGGNPQILRDTGFGVLVVAAYEVELIVAAVCEPTPDNIGGEPGPPAALDRHTQEDLCNDEAGGSGRKRQENDAQEIYGVGIALLDGVENGAVPDIDPVLEADIDADQDQHPDRARPGETIAAPAPVTARADPETRQQVSLARLL